MSQLTTRAVGLSSILHTAAFNRGFNDAQNGKPLIYELYADVNAQWNYERGRQFSFFFSNKIKNQRKKVLFEAVIAYAKALHTGHML
jgi:hypothetical protein